MSEIRRASETARSPKYRVTLTIEARTWGSALDLLQIAAQAQRHEPPPDDIDVADSPLGVRYEARRLRR